MDTNFDELLGLVGDLGEKLHKNPRGNEVFVALLAGKITQEQAVEALFRILREEGLLEEAQIQSKKLMEALDPHNEGLLPVAPDHSSGKSVVNPLWEAALAERVALDGDVPELRHGPLPPEGKPAVPVVLEGVTDPVMVGVMLDRASQEVQAQLLSATREYSEFCQKTLTLTEKRARDTGADLSRALEVARKMLPEAPTGIPGYLAGEKPELFRVSVPSGSEVLLLEEEKARYYSHLALSTTQGRVSLSFPIQERILRQLEQRGLKVSLGEVKAPLVRAKWIVASYGAGDFSPQFNFVESAILALAERLSADLPKNLTEIVLEVVPFNGISTRTFGWEARIG
jgi:hypothetical protein